MIYEIANLVFEITRQVIVFQKNPDFVGVVQLGGAFGGEMVTDFWSRLKRLGGIIDRRLSDAWLAFGEPSWRGCLTYRVSRHAWWHTYRGKSYRASPGASGHWRLAQICRQQSLFL